MGDSTSWTDDDARENAREDSSDGWGRRDGAVSRRRARARASWSDDDDDDDDASASSSSSTLADDDDDDDDAHDDDEDVGGAWTSMMDERRGSDDSDGALDVSEELARPAFFVEEARRASAEAAARAAAESAAGAGAFDDDADVEDVADEDEDDGWNEDASWEEGWGARARAAADAPGKATTSRMAMLPTSDPIARAPWRARLPHFVPVSELAPHAFHEGEIVHVDYVAQFGGAKSKSSVGAGARQRASASEFGGARAATAPKTTPRWYTDERGRKTFVDDRGVARVGAAAYRASQKAATTR